MENKFIKLLFLIIVLTFANKLRAQNNPGFLGKKFALGYSLQLCPARTFYFDSPRYGKNMTNHDFILEYATSKFRSLAFCMSYQKIPVLPAEGYSLTTKETFSSNGQLYTADYGFGEDPADFRALSFGLRYNFYRKDKTISAPIGYCRYLRLDVFKNKAITNYDYNVQNKSELTLAQQIIASNPPFEEAKTTNYSIGYGVESKIAISQYMFIRVNGEFNLSTALFVPYPESIGNDYPTIKDNLTHKSATMNRFRNMFLFGFGIGALL